MGMISGARAISGLVDGSLSGATLETNLATASYLSSFRDALNNRRYARMLAESTTGMNALILSATGLAAAGSEAVFVAAAVASSVATNAICGSATAIKNFGTGGGALYKSYRWTYKAAGSIGSAEIVQGNGIAVNVTNGTIQSSTDGITWTNRTNPNTLTNGAVGGLLAYGNGIFVCIDNSSTNKAMTSTDGITWAARTLPASNSWHSVAFFNGYFVLVSATNNNSYISTDGITWSTIFTGQTMLIAQAPILAGDKEIYSFASGSLDVFNPSPVATSQQTSRSNSGVTNSYHAGYINGTLFVADATTSYKYSLDRGFTWLTGTLPIAPYGARWGRLPVLNGRIYLPVVTSASQSTQVMSSSDGVNWYIENIGAQGALTVLGGVNGLLVAQVASSVFTQAP